MKKIVAISFLIFVCGNSYCQFFLQYDTINIITLKKVDTTNNKIYESEKIFCIKGIYYHGNNSPFLSLKTKCNEKKIDKLFNLNYAPIVNYKSINELNKRLKKNIFQRITPFDELSKITSLSLSNETKFIIDCLLTENKNIYLISEQKVVAAFFILDCGIELGVHDVIFCPQKVITSQTPVLLNVTNFIK